MQGVLKESETLFAAGKLHKLVSSNSEASELPWNRGNALVTFLCKHK